MDIGKTRFRRNKFDRLEFDGGIKLIEMMVNSIVKNGDKHDIEHYREKLEDLANKILDISEAMSAEDDFIHIPKIVRNP